MDFREEAREREEEEGKREEERLPWKVHAPSFTVSWEFCKARRPARLGS